MEKKEENPIDTAFKNLMSDSYILSNMLKPLVKELNDKDIEYIRHCLPIEGDNRDIVKMNSEYSDMDGIKGIMDNTFQLNIPGKDPISIIVDVEGQADRSPGYPLENRAVYYCACMIHGQKKVFFDNDDYGKIRKAIGVWVILNPRRDERNTVVRYRMDKGYLPGFEGGAEIPDCDLIEIFRINIGSDSDLDGGMMGMMNTLFCKGLDDRKRVEVLSDVYKIPDADSLFRKVEAMTLTLDEEYAHTIICDAIDDGKVCSREYLISSYVETVRKLSEKDLDLEEILSTVPAEIRDEVKLVFDKEQ